MKKIILKKNIPCNKCPYKLGLVHSVVNPCPQCKLENYQAYDFFQKQQAGANLKSKK